MIIELVLALAVIVLIWRIIARKEGLPPGPTPFPIVGNIPQLALSGSKPYVAFDNLAKKYGDIMTIRLGSADAVVLSSSKAMRDVLSKEEWSGRIFEESLKARYLNQRLGILFMEGEAWKDQKRFLLRHIKDLGYSNQTWIESMIFVELNELKSRLRQKMADGKQAVVYMHNYFNLSIVNVLWTLIAGMRYAHDDEKLLTLMKHLDTLMRCGSVGNLSSMFPILRKIAPKLTGDEEQLAAYKTLQDFLHELIQEKRQNDEYGLSKSFLDIYLQEIDKSPSDDSIYTEDQLKMLCFDMFLAGSETTSNSLCFAVLYMMLHPKIQDKVYLELVHVVGDATPSLAHKPKLPYIQAVLMEVLRLSNIAPLTIPHTIMGKDATYKNYTIPKDTIVMVNIYSAHMDENQWKNHDTFCPQRHLNEKGEIIKNDSFLPFGIGKRSCLGESLAMTTLYLYFATLMKYFKFETVPGHLSPSAEPVLGFTQTPQPYHSVITLRQ